MFVGRDAELDALERLYRKRGFQMAVVYGRRRIGKTTLIDRFARSKNALFFTAQQKSAAQNLALFSQEVYRYFQQPSETGAFATWGAAFDYVARKATELDGRFLFVFDEFPYAAEAEPSLPSTLQVAIDHKFKEGESFIILCGSNEGFMESEVLGRKSPLYGRRTSQIRLAPLDYLDAAKMIPGTSVEDKVRYYSTFGGTPYYIEQIEPERPYEENVAELFFDISGLLYEEPLMLLRQELREPALYNSILDAIGSGANRPKEIAERAGVPADSMSKYLATLENLGIVAKSIPFGENPTTSRKGIYSLKDPLFAYWYRFVSSNVGAIEAGAGKAVAQATAFGDRLSTYVGIQFEEICRQWLIRQNAAGNLPFLATSFGKWWGTDPAKREQADIDVVAANPQGKRIILCECKWRNSFDESAAIAELEARAKLISGYERPTFYLFSKHQAGKGTQEKAQGRNDLFLVCAEEMYRG